MNNRIEKFLITAMVLCAIAGAGAVMADKIGYEVATKRAEEINENVYSLEEKISQSSNLTNIDFKHSTIEIGETNGLLTFFGTYLKQSGVFADKYIVLGKCTYTINKDLAQKIYDRINDCGSTAKSGVLSEHTFSKIGFSKKVLTNINDVLYLMEEAVKTAETKKIVEIGPQAEFERSLLKAYVYSNPTIATEVSGLMTSSSLIDAGISLLNVSDVYYDVEKDLTFFYLDTASKGTSVVYKKTQVGFEGNISAVDAYVNFINGEYDMFREVRTTQEIKNVNVLYKDNELQ